MIYGFAEQLLWLIRIQAVVLLHGVTPHSGESSQSPCFTEEGDPF